MSPVLRVRSWEKKCVNGVISKRRIRQTFRTRSCHVCFHFLRICNFLWKKCQTHIYSYYLGGYRLLTIMLTPFRRCNCIIHTIVFCNFSNILPNLNYPLWQLSDSESIYLCNCQNILDNFQVMVELHMVAEKIVFFPFNWLQTTSNEL